MRWINADAEVEITIFDEQYDDHMIKRMTVEEMLDRYTNDGCPTLFCNPPPERKKGRWITETINSYTYRTYCSVCNNNAPELFMSDDYCEAYGEIKPTNYCPSCGADMMGGEGMTFEEYEEMLDEAVESGKLTEEEAREELMWFQITGEE